MQTLLMQANDAVVERDGAKSATQDQLETATL